MKHLVFLAGLLLLAQGVQAQERRVEETDLPRWVADDVIDYFNDPRTIRFTGRSRIPSTRTIGGDVASLGGPFMLAGEIDGDLVVVNGDLVFEEGGAVTGDVMVLGGRVLAPDLGEIGGSVTVYEDRLEYVQEGDRIAAAGPGRSTSHPFSSEIRFGRTRFTIRAGQNYNRVEGLPVMFGPIIESGGEFPLRVEAFGVWRTETGFGSERDDFGYAVRIEQSLDGLPGRLHLSIGATAQSLITPIEEWGITDLEASLATFLLHRDYRDYYEREGWSGYVRLRLPYLPLTLRADYMEERHSFAPVGGPWSLKDNDDPWRPQPLVAEGRLRSVGGELLYDSRDSRKHATQGIYLQAGGRGGRGGSLTMPAHDSTYAFPPPGAGPRDIAAQPVNTDFITGLLDLRSYNRVGPRSEMRLRGLLAGSMNGEPVPPQYQHALGGEGSIPGFPLFLADCGARAGSLGYEFGTDGGTAYSEVYPAYGCNRIALFQAEYRGGSFFGWDIGPDRGDDWDWYPSIEFNPSWSVFFNVGRGWALAETATGFIGQDTDTLMDVGFGVFLGDLGFYWAFPLEDDEDRGGNFFIRLTHRF